MRCGCESYKIMYDVSKTESPLEVVVHDRGCAKRSGPCFVNSLHRFVVQSTGILC